MLQGVPPDASKPWSFLDGAANADLEAQPRKSVPIRIVGLFGLVVVRDDRHCPGSEKIEKLLHR
jgi:hypothetical protein